jgi:hypothetical protein
MPSQDLGLPGPGPRQSRDSSYLSDGVMSWPTLRDRVGAGQEPDANDRQVRTFGADRDFAGALDSQEVVPWLIERNTALPSAANRIATYQPDVADGDLDLEYTRIQGTRVLRPVPSRPSTARSGISDDSPANIPFTRRGPAWRIRTPRSCISGVFWLDQLPCRSRIRATTSLNDEPVCTSSTEGWEVVT